MSSQPEYHRVFGTLFIIISLFALVGSLYTWGEGPITEQDRDLILLLPLTDLVVTLPLALVAGIGLLRDSEIGKISGLLLAGILIFGSCAVYIQTVLIQDYDLTKLIPPVFGLGLAFSYVRWYTTLLSKYPNYDVRRNQPSKIGS